MVTEKSLRTCDKGHQYYKSTDCPSCPVCDQENKPKEGFLSKLSAPARNALLHEGIDTVEKLSKYTEKAILQLHGIGPASLPVMRASLEAEGLSFQPATTRRKNKMTNSKELAAQQREQILQTLQARFEKHTSRHEGLEWINVQAKLEANEDKLWSLYQMEETGGEPDVISYNQETDEYTFYDCAAESPKGRRSVCYDHEALEARKKHKPENSAVGMAADMGIELLTEEQYRALQQLGEFDLKTSSWVQTPDSIRKHGGAIFCDRRYDTVFVYHNGADSYYAARGFRGSLKV